MGTLVAIFWLLSGPAEDLSALCDRLADRANDPVEEIVRRVAAGEADPAAVAERARALRGHPQAFVRRRAAEVLLAVATEEGALWLRAELLLYRSWCRMDRIDCCGGLGGFPGRVERLLREAHGVVEPDPWDTPPVAVPPETFRAVVCPVPWEKAPTYRVFLLNATSEPFVRATEDRAGMSFRWSRPRNMGGGAGGSFPHGAHRLREVPPGGLAF